jgi:hypothetical protein
MQRRHFHLAAAMAAAVPVGLTRPAMAQQDRGQYTIQRAVYGSSSNSVDVTPRLRELAARDERVRLTNDLFGVDPHKGVEKTLRITATDPAGRAQVFEYVEGGWIDGTIFQGWATGQWGRGTWNGGSTPGAMVTAPQYRVVRAFYGTLQNNLDVTARVRELIGRNDRFRVVNDTFDRDPAPGVPKMLRVEARAANGQTRFFEFPEDSRFDLAPFVADPGAAAATSPGTAGLNEALRIVRAEYGADDRWTDITAILQARVTNGRMMVRIDNDLAGSDPAPKRPKELWLVYSTQGQQRRRLVPEGQFISLP